MMTKKMMMKYSCLFVIFILSIFVFPTVVFAEESEEEEYDMCKDYSAYESWANEVKSTFEACKPKMPRDRINVYNNLKSGSYSVNVDCGDIRVKSANVKFKSFFNPGYDRSYGSSVSGNTVSVSGLKSEASYYGKYIFNISAYMQHDECSDWKLDGHLYKTLYYSGFGEKKTGTPVQTKSVDPVLLESAKPIDCSKTYPEGSLENKFCAWKSKVAEKDYVKFKKASNDPDAFDFSVESGKQDQSFVCDPTDYSYDIKNFDKDNYYSNGKYMYGWTEYKLSFGNYEQNFGGQDENGKGTEVKTLDEVSCKIKCEEAVNVQYGPPVAAQAGLCFQYKVKVTSITSCGMTEEPKTPPVPDNNYCTPGAACEHYSGSCTNDPYEDKATTETAKQDSTDRKNIKDKTTVGEQIDDNDESDGEDCKRVGVTVGPSEDFDRCIMKCDNGSYSKKCNRDCYKQVYGNSSSSKTASSYNDATASKLAEVTSAKNRISYIRSGYRLDPETGKMLAYDGGTEKDYNGRYRLNGSTINWTTLNGDTVWPAGWYYENSGALTGSGIPQRVSEDGQNAGSTSRTDLFSLEYVTDEGLLSNGDCSNSSCTHLGCTDGGQYLNPGEAQTDYNNNFKKYEEAIKKCHDKTKCNTTTSEFTISADYMYKENGTLKPKKTIYFPYSDSNTPDSSNVKVDVNDHKCVEPETIMLQTNGCYKGQGCNLPNYNGESPRDDTNYYLAEWSFPGTWFHNKTGDISYDSKDNQSGWVKKDKEFCIPLDQANVNVGWWRKYMYEKYISNINTSYADKNYLRDIAECKTNGETVANQCIEKVKSTSFKSSDIKEDGGTIYPNLHANAKNFGYFSWNINVDCFFASAYGFSAKDDYITSDQPCERCVESNPEKKEVRTVDLTQLFPGDPLTSSSASSSSGGSGSSGTSSSSGGSGSTVSTTRTPGFNWSSYATNDIDESYKSYPDKYASWVQEKNYSIFDDNNGELEYYVILNMNNISNLRKAQNRKNFAEFKDSYLPIGKTDTVSHYKSNLIHGNECADCINVKVKPEPDSALTCNNIKNGRECFNVENAG